MAKYQSLYCCHLSSWTSDDLVLAFDDSKEDGIPEKSPVLESEAVEIKEFLWVLAFIMGNR